jgi:hypothetical protein
MNRGHYGTADRRSESAGFITVDYLRGIRNFSYTTQAGERLDALAHKFFKEDSYWWLLALINGLDYAAVVQPGTKLRIPYNVNDVLKKIFL